MCRVVGLGVVHARGDDVANQEDVGIRGHRAVGIHDSLGVFIESLLSKHPASSHSRARKFGLEHVVIHRPEGRELLDVKLVGDTFGSELIEQGFGDSCKLSSVHAWGNERVGMEAQVAQLEIAEHVVLDPEVGKIVVRGNTLIEESLVGRVGEVDVKAEGGGGKFGEGLDGGRKDYAKGTRSSTLESPVEIGVLVRVGSDNISVRKEDVEGKNLVGTYDTSQS